MSESRFWDKIFLKTRDFYLTSTLADYQQREFCRFVEKSSGITQGAVLKTDTFEEAFGNAAVMNWFAERNSQVIGMDISFEIINSAKKKIRGDTFRWSVADAACLPFKDNTFDTIFSTNTYGYLNDPAQGLQEARRILKPNGELIISVRNKNNIMSEGARFLRKNKFPAADAFTGRRFRKILEEAGFIVERNAYIVHIPAFLNPMMRFLESKKSALPRAMLTALMRKIERFSRENHALKYFTGWFIVFSARKL